jgi:transcription elongation GreA/GreB family factor
MTDKTLLKNTMLGLEAEKLAYSEQAYAAFLSGSARDYSEAADHGQISQESNDAELAQGFEGPIHTLEEAMVKLRAIDFSAKTEVEEGAAVRFGGNWFVIAVATAEFDCDGITYMGISKDAPIFKAMEGKSAGEKFEFNGRKMKIEAVA